MRATLGPVFLLAMAFYSSVQPMDSFQAVQSSTKRDQKNPKVAAAKPLSLDGVEKLVEGIQNRDISESYAVKTLTDRGIDFIPSADNLEFLKSAKAPHGILDYIEAHIPPPPIPHPKPFEPEEGRLAVVCAPVDCSVEISGGSSSKTTQGKLEVPKLPVGSITVTASAEGYETEQKSVVTTIKKDITTELTFTFKPNRETLEKAGADFFQKMLDALGGEEALRNVELLRASGDLNVLNREGKSLRWSLVVLIKVPDKAKFFVHRENQKYEIARTSDGFKWNKTPKEGSGDVEDALQLFREYQLSSFLAHITKAKSKVIPSKLNLSDVTELTLSIDSGSETYVIHLTPDLRPKEIMIQSQGLTSGLRVLYSDYESHGKVLYPNVTEVVLPGDPRRGIEARFEKVELNPSGIQDSDFIVKGKVSLR